MSKRFLSITLAALALCFFASSCVKEDGFENRVKEIVQLDSLNAKLAALAAQVKQMNTDIASLQRVVSALEKNLYITDVEETSEGCTLYFSDGTYVTIRNGKDGVDGQDGKDAPVVGVKDSLGIYYWVLVDKTQTPADTSWILDKDGNAIRVTGEDGKDGAEIGVKDTLASVYWVKIDKSKSPADTSWLMDKDSNLVQAEGKDGDSWFSNVEPKGGYVVLTLAGGGTITLPYKSELDKLVSSIQKIEPVSDYRDGSVIIANGERTAEFFVTPDSLASKLAAGFAANKTKFTFLAYRTLTKATTFDTLKVTNVTGANGILQVTIDGSRLPSAFVHDSVSYNGYLKVSDTVNSALTGTFPLIRPIYPEADSLECVTINGVTWASVNCGYEPATKADLSDGYVYGKLYQFARAKGCGYNSKWDSNSKGPENQIQDWTDNPASTQHPEHNKFYKGVSRSGNYDWYSGDRIANWPMKPGDEAYTADTIANLCPDGWRVPLDEELDILCYDVESVWTQRDGINGYLFAGKLFLPAAGFRERSNGVCYKRGEKGYYLCRTWGRSYQFDSTGKKGTNDEPSMGQSVRCVLE